MDHETSDNTKAASPHVAGLSTFLMAREGLVGRGAVNARLVELATPGLVKSPNGSPNRIAFNGVGLPVV
jgi:oryzin